MYRVEHLERFDQIQQVYSSMNGLYFQFSVKWFVIAKN
jgi:hypothetical protein